MKASKAHSNGVLFSFADVIAECRLLKRFAADFLDADTVDTLDAAAARLEYIQDVAAKSKAKHVSWGINERRPLTTRYGVGAHQPGRQQGRELRGTFSFIWEITPVPPPKGNRPLQFVLDGNASTTITIEQRASGNYPACQWQWNADIGVSGGPGTRFHAQIKWHEPPLQSLETCKISTLDVPRFPMLPMTPLMVVELVLAELFQDEWKKQKHEASDRDTNQWRMLQAKRLIAFLEWQVGTLKARAGTPLLTLKLAPVPENVMGEERP